MMWTEWQCSGAVLALRLVMDVARPDGPEMDALADLILPKLVKRSGLDAVTFQAIVRTMHRAEEEPTKSISTLLNRVMSMVSFINPAVALSPTFVTSNVCR
jgi:hypothetical protein